MYSNQVVHPMGQVPFSAQTVGSFINTDVICCHISSLNVEWSHSSVVSFVLVDTNKKVNCRSTLAQNIQMSSLLFEVIVLGNKKKCML